MFGDFFINFKSSLMAIIVFLKALRKRQASDSWQNSSVFLPQELINGRSRSQNFLENLSFRSVKRNRDRRDLAYPTLKNKGWIKKKTLDRK